MEIFSGTDAKASNGCETALGRISAYHSGSDILIRDDEVDCTVDPISLNSLVGMLHDMTRRGLPFVLTALRAPNTTQAQLFESSGLIKWMETKKNNGQTLAINPLTNGTIARADYFTSFSPHVSGLTYLGSIVGRSLTTNPFLALVCDISLQKAAPHQVLCLASLLRCGDPGNNPFPIAPHPPSSVKNVLQLLEGQQMTGKMRCAAATHAILQGWEDAALDVLPASAELTPREVNKLMIKAKRLGYQRVIKQLLG